MGNDERGTSLHEFPQSRFNEVLRLRIERRRWLVEDKDVGLLQERAGERDALLLPNGKFHAAPSDKLFIFFRKGIDEIVGMRFLRGHGDILFARGAIAISDVLSNLIIEKRRLLRHNTETGSIRREVETSDVGAIDQDLAALRKIKTGKQVDHGRLSYARLADQRDLFPGSRVKRNVF